MHEILTMYTGHSMNGTVSWTLALAHNFIWHVLFESSSFPLLNKYIYVVLDLRTLHYVPDGAGDGTPGRDGIQKTLVREPLGPAASTSGHVF